MGWLGDLAGHLPLEDGIEAACLEGLQHLQAGGAQVQDARLESDPEKLWQCWLVWRRALVGPKVAALLQLPGAREKIKPEALWEYDNSMQLSFMDFMKASQTRSAFYQSLRQLFTRFDVLALPVAQVWPFPLAERWPKQIAGRPMDTYHRWMECTLYATLAGLPALSLPAAFHPRHAWPMGLQLIAGPNADRTLLRVAAAYERLRAPWMAQRPEEPGRSEAPRQTH